MFVYYFKQFFSHIQKSFLIKKFIFKKVCHIFVKEIIKSFIFDGYNSARWAKVKKLGTSLQQTIKAKEKQLI